MQIDGIYLSLLTEEFRRELEGARVEQIYQPDPGSLEIMFTGHKRLFINVGGSTQHARLTASTFEHPATPLAFSMLLRKALGGSRLLRVDQPGCERLFSLEFGTTDELGNPSALKVIVELMGRHSNVILTDSAGKILDAIKRVYLDQSQVHPIVPGSMYSLPPNTHQVIDPRQVSGDELLNILEGIPEGLARAIVTALTGMSPLLAAEVMWRAGISGEETLAALDGAAKQRLKSAWQDFLSEIGHVEVITGGRSPVVSPVPLTSMANQPGSNRTVGGNANELLDHLLTNIEKQAGLETKKQALDQAIKSILKRVETRLSRQLEDLRSTKDADQWQHYGNLLYAHIGEFKNYRGRVIRLVNYYDESLAETDVPLDESKTLAQNAETYLKRYRKAVNAKRELSARIPDTEQERDFLADTLDRVKAAETRDEVEAVRSSLEQMGVVSPKTHGAKGRRSNPHSLPLKYVSRTGVVIWVGRNAEENHYLTFTLAQPTDTWLHVKDYPGAHVIVKSASPDDRTIKDAALLAAYHSGLRASSHVSVDYTRAKFVRHQSGGGPGQVIYDHHRTVLVTPEEEQLPSRSLQIND